MANPSGRSKKFQPEQGDDCWVCARSGARTVQPNIFARKGSGSYYTPDDLVQLILTESPLSKSASAPSGTRSQSWGRGTWLCCAKSEGDSAGNCSVVIVVHEQTHPSELQDQELASV